MGTRQFDKLVLAAVAGTILSACQTVGSNPIETGMRSEIRRQALARAPSYARLDSSKVMVACIDWAKTELPKMTIPFVHMTYTGIGSDVPVGFYRLSENSTAECNRIKAERGLNCECTDLLHDNEVVLRRPG